MKEILFRGKRIDNDEWIEGGITFMLNHENTFIAPERFSDYDDEIWIDKNTLGQFIGKTDKNGKKIFEGDIVKDHFGNVGVVWYSEHYLRWQVSFYKGRADLCKYPEIGTYIFDWTYPNVDFEIIGNIYDNSELLEEHK